MDSFRVLIVVLLIAFIPKGAKALDLQASPGEYSIEKALQQAREKKRLDNEKDITIHLKSGTYNLYESIIIRPEDSGIKIVGDGKVEISGGVKITSWEKQGDYFVGDVPQFNGRPLEFRQLYVNGKKAIRSRDVEDFNNMYRIKSFDREKEIIYVPKEAVEKIIGAKRAEMVLHEMWCIANLRIKDIEIRGDSAAVTFHQPESHIHFMHPWPSPMVTSDGHNSAFYITGAKEFLDTPGEWYLDTQNSKVYYLPLEGENIETLDVIAPCVETLLKVEGTPDNPVKDVKIENVTFCYSTWMRPSISGHAPLQAGMYMTEAYKLRPQINRPNGDHKLDNQGWVGRPASAVEVLSAENVDFLGCEFIHLASSGLDYFTYIKGGHIDRCIFNDIGGNAIVAGSFSPQALEAHLPYDPMDRRIICTNLSITNNLITDVANEDWGCVGIAAGFVRDIKISHNEISEVSYTGISIGWGWNQQACSMANNLINGNLIHHYAKHMYDTAGIYTLGAQPHSLIEENVVRDIYSPSYAHDPNHWFYLYTDEGSSYITIRNNWTPSEKFLQNANGPGNTWENNGPQVNDSIKNSAGIIKP